MLGRLNGFRFSALLLTLFISSTAFAEQAMLTVPADLNVLYINGEKHNGSFFNTEKKQLELPQGINKLVFEYERFFGDDDDFDHAKSEPFLLTVTLKKNAHYQVLLPEIKNFKAAKAFMKKPELSVENSETSELIASELRVKQTEDAFLQGLVVSDETAKGGDQAQVVNQPSNQPNQQSEALQQLHNWWQKADASERQQFLQQVLSK